MDIAFLGNLDSTGSYALVSQVGSRLRLLRRPIEGTRMHDSLLPRLKTNSVETILEMLKETKSSNTDSLDVLREYLAFKSRASNRVTRANGVAFSVFAELRRIAQKSGFPIVNIKAAPLQFDQDAEPITKTADYQEA